LKLVDVEGIGHREGGERGCKLQPLNYGKEEL